MKKFHLPLLATALPTLLAACADDVDLDGYGRRAFRTDAECRVAYKHELQHGLTNPCTGERVGSSGRVIYWGPYTSRGASGTSYLGYDQTGKVARSGLQLSPIGRVNKYRTPTVNRGGCTCASSTAAS